MSRFWYLGALLLATTLAAQNTATVQQVTVRGSGSALEVEIKTSGAPISPNTQAITGPDRIVVDFPGAIPAADLRALKVNRGALKAVRSGLFFSNPPITRIVLDLAEPQSYKISTSQNTIVVKLAAATASANAPVAGAHLQNVALSSGSPSVSNVSSAHLPVASPSNKAVISSANIAPANNGAANAAPVPIATAAIAVASATALQPADVASADPAAPPKPLLNVSYENGLLRIHTDKATLAQVLFEVHLKTQADIAIPAGAEQEQVVADLGPAPARDVLGALLNGSSYNFIFVGNELSLEKVILTRRDNSIF